MSILLSVAMRLIVGRRPGARFVSKRLKLRQRVVLLLLGVGLGILYATAPHVVGSRVQWRPSFIHVFEVVMILATGWLLTGVLGAVEDGVIASTNRDADSPHVRRLQTQMQVINRVGSALIWMIAVGVALYTFPELRIVGNSVFASAGVVSIVAGLAAQSTLSNLFAGLQLAFTDAIRVNDAVVVQISGTQGTMGRIEEITLTYVVVRVWDDRRIILPSTFFTTHGFENWSRRDPEMLGTVEFDLDWMIPVEAMRAEFKRQLSDLELWDGRVGVLQVTDTTGSQVRVRALVSARNSAELWDLRCQIREGMVGWLQNRVAYALPRVRMEPRPTTAPSEQQRVELTEQTKKNWEAKQAADESQDAIMTQLIDLPDGHPAKTPTRRPKPSIYGSTRRTGWKRPRRTSQPIPDDTSTGPSHPSQSPTRQSPSGQSPSGQARQGQDADTGHPLSRHGGAATLPTSPGTRQRPADQRAKKPAPGSPATPTDTDAE